MSLMLQSPVLGEKDSVLACVGFVTVAVFLIPAVMRSQSFSVKEELQRHLYVAIPTILRYLFFSLSDCFFIALVGHYDSSPVSQFAGVNMGVMLVNVTGLSLGIGFAGALGPFISQEYGTGCANRSGLHFQNFIKCASAIFLFALGAAYNSEALLLVLGQDSEVASCVQRYARVAVWALPSQICTKGLQQVLDAQRDVGPGLVADVAGALMQVPLSWSVLRSGGGFEGAAYVKVFVNSLIGVLLVGWIQLTGRAKSVWSLPADEPRASLVLFLKQAVPNTFACCVEWWAQEGMALLAGLLPHASLEVAANGVLFNCAVIFYMVWVGSKNATSTRVGNLIGSGHPEKVQQAILVGLGLCALEVLAVVLLGLRYRSALVSMFTASMELQQAVLQTWSTMLFCLLPYSFTFTLFGVLSGAGHQSMVAYVFLVSVLIGMPIGAYLSFALELGLDGLWLGNAIFFGIASAVLYYKVLQIDWSSMKTLENYIQIEDAAVGA